MLLFPWMMHKPGGDILIVHNEAQQEAALRDGWVKTFDEAQRPAPPAPIVDVKKGKKKA